MQYAVETRGLRKTYRSTAAVDGIDLLVPARSVTGFLGPNGAGKTTAIRMLLGLLKPDAGQIRILEMDMPAARRRIARQVGSLVETPSHYDNLTGSENLQITHQGRQMRPAAIVALTPGWGRQRLAQQEDQRAIYAFSGKFDYNQGLTVRYGVEPSDQWSSIIPRLETERAKIMARAAAK